MKNWSGCFYKRSFELQYKIIFHLSSKLNHWTLGKNEQGGVSDLSNSDIIHTNPTLPSNQPGLFKHALIYQVIHDLSAFLLEYILFARHQIFEIDVQYVSTDNDV